MGNSKGSGSPARNKYDKLPHSVKVALQEARFNWAPGSFYTRFESGRMTAKAMVKYIQKLDRTHAIKEARRVWGPDYPVELIR